jgi:NhaP-type Na+/H+ or K+/H+ antiporter
MGWELAVIAAATIGFALVSGRLEGTSITPAIFFVGVGLLFGTEALGVFDLPPTGESVKVLAEATLALVLFTDASRIDLRTLRREHTLPVRLLGVGLPLTIVAGGLLAGLLFGSLSVAEALVLGVMLAPTDAALGQPVLAERRLPSRIRQGLNVESGLNDGICVPLLFITLAFAEAEAGKIGDAHAVRLVFEQIGWGIGGGLVGGVVAAGAVVYGSRRRLIAAAWLQVIPAAGAALAYGVAAPLGGSGFIAAFVSGMVFGAICRNQGRETTRLTEEVGDVLSGVTLLVFGAVLLSPTLGAIDWRIGLYAVSSLTVVRMVPVAIALLGTGARGPTVAFLGWFGPRGLASIVFAPIVVEEAHLPHAGTLLSAVYTTVGLSVLVHGLTAAPLARRYASWFGSHPSDRLPAMESVPAAAHQLRGSA